MMMMMLMLIFPVEMNRDGRGVVCLCFMYSLKKNCSLHLCCHCRLNNAVSISFGVCFFCDVVLALLSAIFLASWFEVKSERLVMRCVHLLIVLFSTDSVLLYG